MNEGVVTRLIALFALVLGGLVTQRGPIHVAVDVRGGTCRPAPEVTLFAADGRDLATAMAAGGTASVARVDGLMSPPRYLLADCRAYYVAGHRVAPDSEGAYRIRLDRAVPPQHRGHADGVHVRVEDGDGRGTVPGVRVYWVFDDGREAGEAMTDEGGRATLPMTSDNRLPRWVLADAVARGYQITGQHVRLGFDDYVLLLRPVTPF